MLVCLLTGTVYIMVLESAPSFDDHGFINQYWLTVFGSGWHRRGSLIVGCRITQVRSVNIIFVSVLYLKFIGTLSSHLQPLFMIFSDQY